MGGRSIQYLAGHEVNREKWDQCISRSSNGLIYHSSIYLDIMADHWNAAVIGDYDAVMPLPWRKKYFLKYYYHVPFIPQGGVVGHVTPEDFKELTRYVFRNIRFGDLLLNAGNASFAKYLAAVPLVNMVLDLSQEHSCITKEFHRDLLKNLKRASRFPLQYAADTNIKGAVNVFRKLYGSKMAVREQEFERFTGLCLHLQKEGKAITRKVIDHKGRLMAIAVLLRDSRRLYNIMNTVTPEGRKRSANHFLFEQLIGEFSGSGYILDFEGSQIPGIRKFYENFGAVDEPYFWYRRYPFSLR